jgi:tetratricopeptide (TPR) repeat protein
VATKDLPSWKKKRLKGEKGLAEQPDAFQSKKKQSRATAAFGKALELESAEIKPADKPDKPGTAEEPPDPDALPTFKTQDERAAAVLSALDKVKGDFGGTSAASRADLLRGATLFKLGKLPEAEQAFKSYLSSAGHSDPLRFVATEGLGYVLEAKGDLDGALARFGELDPDPSKPGSGFGEERALYHQARIYTEKKDPKKAAELLHKLVSQYPTSPLRKDAQERLATLEPG